MSLYPVSLVVFYKWFSEGKLEVWTQKRTDDGPYQGLWEFPGGGVEIGERPQEAAVREIFEEVCISINENDLEFMGTYLNQGVKKNILLYVYLCKNTKDLIDRGQWFEVTHPHLTQELKGKIPEPNHKIINDIFFNFLENMK